MKGTSVELFYQFPQLSEFSTLLPGSNYGLCMKSDLLTDPAPKKPEQNFYCARFSVYTPFFQFPVVPKTKCHDSDGKQVPCYHDPEPYKLVEVAGHPEQDVAIFGVVDPSLGQDVGMLNFAWSNYYHGHDDKKYRTETAVKDPGEALHEIVAYFEQKYKLENHGQEFSGVRILLAQMTPEEAQKLATRVGRFDAVVSDADPQLSGVGETQKAQWDLAGPDSKEHHAFLAVPQPYWVSTKDPKERVDLGKLIIDTAPGETEKTFIATHEEEKNPPGPEKVTPPGGFWKAVSDYVNKHCLTAADKPLSLSGESSDSENEKGMESLTGCIMQKEIGADVVLLQERDFYFDWKERDPKTFTFQQFIDRMIWKGDFLTLMYLPGSTLQNVMNQSKAFKEGDNSQLSLSNETKRGLVYFGIRQDPSRGGYLINEVPLDPTRVYAVATSDFIATGDTGYPEMATNAIRQFSSPRDFDKQLKNISGIVCQRLTLQGGENPATSCIDPIKRDDYFDELAVLPNDTRQGNTWRAHLWEWSIFDQPKVVPEKKRASERPVGVDAQIEQRHLGSIRINQPDTTLFAIDDAALTLNVTNHRFSDAGLAQSFIGNPTPQLSAKRSHTIGYDIQPKFLYSLHRYQFFEDTEMR